MTRLLKPALARRASATIVAIHRIVAIEDSMSFVVFFPCLMMDGCWYIETAFMGALDGAPTSESEGGVGGCAAGAAGGVGPCDAAAA